MRIFHFFIVPSIFLVLSSCTIGLPVDNTTPTPSDEVSIQEDFVASPTHAYIQKELELADKDIVSLSGVMDIEFKYLDSLAKQYNSATFSEIIRRYPQTIVYFYPKDGTPNCTIQALDFSMMLEDFQSRGYNIIGISKDDLESHKVFAERNELKIELLQDPDGVLLRAFGAEGPLQTYGNGDELSDIIRSTYVVTADGEARFAIQDVEAKGHARAIWQLVTGEEYVK